MSPGRRLAGCLLSILRLGVALLLILFAVGIFTHPGRAALRSIGVMIEIFPAAPVYPLRLFTRAPQVSRVEYGEGDSRAVADIYRPAGSSKHGALLFSIGVGPEQQNPHVVRVCKALARAGVVVMVPTSKQLSEFRVVPEEKENIVTAFEYLKSLPDVDTERIGMMGVSAGGSLVAVAAEDGRIAEQVRLVEMFGSYYSTEGLISALTLRRIEVNGRWEEWQPEQVSVDVFRQMLLPFAPADERARISPLFDGRQTALPPRLSPEGAAIAQLLVNRDPARVRPLIQALPAAAQRSLAGISPSTNIGALQAELFLMHDRDDHIIPFTESQQLYAVASPERGKHLTELRLFRHVEPGSVVDPMVLLRELPKLFQHVYAVLFRLT